MMIYGMARPIRDKSPIPEKPISVRLHQPVRAQLLKVAAKNGVSGAELIRQIVTDALFEEGKYQELTGKSNDRK